MTFGMSAMFNRQPVRSSEFGVRSLKPRTRNIEHRTFFVLLFLLCALCAPASAQLIRREMIENSDLIVLHNFTAIVAPEPSDDSSAGYSVGSIWLDTVAGNIYQARSVAVGAADWACITCGGATTPTLQQVGNAGRILEADCSDPLKVAKTGDSTTYWKICHDATDGLQIVPVVSGVEHAANKRVKLTDTYDWCVLDNDDVCIFKLTEAGVFSGSAIKKTVEVFPFDFTTDVTTGEGKFYFRVPTTIDGYSLSGVQVNVITAGTTNATTVGIDRCAATTSGNVCSGTVTDMLATGFSVDSGENSSSDAATPGALSATPANLVVTAGQVIRVNVDAASTTAPKGLIVAMDFTAP